jgi:hypothetical protein
MYLLPIKNTVSVPCIRKYKLIDDRVNSGIISGHCRWLDRSIYGPHFARHCGRQTGHLVCHISEEARCAEDEKRVIVVDSIYTLYGNCQCASPSEKASF